MPRTELRSRSRALISGVVLALGLVTGGCQTTPGASAPTVTGGSNSASVQGAASGERTDRVNGLRTLLDQRATALQRHDRAAWSATVNPNKDLIAQQQQVFDNLGDIALQSVKFEFAGDGPELSAAQRGALGPQAWVAKVVFSYRIANADDGDVRRTQYLTVVPTATGWKVAGTSDGSPGEQRDLWDLAAVHTVRGKRSLVIGTDAEGLRTLANRVDKAASAVDSVWGTDWPRTVVVLVPSSQTELAQLLGRTDEAGLDQIAAVTTGEVGLPVGHAADRVIINPDQFSRMSSAAGQFVLTHEVTHVATRAAGPGAVPTWYSEGFADYVAAETAGYSMHRVAGDVLDRAAKNDFREGLPADSDFDAGKNDHVAATYSTAFLAVSYIARSWSDAAVIELYRAQAGALGPGGTPSQPMPLAESMPKVLGVQESQFVPGWQEFVTQSAADPNS